MRFCSEAFILCFVVGVRCVPLMWLQYDATGSRARVSEGFCDTYGGGTGVVAILRVLW